MSTGKEKQMNKIENTNTYMNLVNLGNLGKFILPHSFRQVIKFFTFLQFLYVTYRISIYVTGQIYFQVKFILT